MAPHETHVALVEDNPQMRQMLRDFLVTQGYQVRDFASAKDFLQTAHSHWMNVVVSDITMPGMDGLELLKRIKKDLAGVPVILFTAFSDQYPAAEVKRLGAVEYLTKPFKLEELAGAIGRSAKKIP